MLSNVQAGPIRPALNQAPQVPSVGVLGKLALITVLAGASYYFIPALRPLLKPVLAASIAGLSGVIAFRHYTRPAAAPVPLESRTVTSYPRLESISPRAPAAMSLQQIMDEREAVPPSTPPAVSFEQIRDLRVEERKLQAILDRTSESMWAPRGLMPSYERWIAIGRLLGKIERQEHLAAEDKLILNPPKLTPMEMEIESLRRELRAIEQDRPQEYEIGKMNSQSTEKYYLRHLINVATDQPQNFQKAKKLYAQYNLDTRFDKVSEAGKELRKLFGFLE